MNVIKVSRIISLASEKPTKLIRVIKDSINHVLAAQKHGVKIGWLIYRCEINTEPPHVKQCFNCWKNGHSAKECKNEQHCMRCSGQHTVKQCTEPKKEAMFANCGGSHASVYKGCSSYQNEVLMQQRRKKILSPQQ